MKRLIFDLDNTLIIWKQEYVKALEETILCYNLDIETKKIDDIIEKLDKKYEMISKQILLDEINNKYNLNLGIDFINTLFEKQSLLAEKDEEVIETLEYLSQKYNLVVLTNYYKEVQEKRLITAEIRKYFEEIYGGDEVFLKPNKKAFDKAMGNYKIEECIMIGDDPIYDIKGAKDIGLEVIAVDYFNKLEDTEEYKTIRNFKELKRIL